eukprot:gnl/Dysnectes_brevis/2915_a3570_1379.p1 GENE.gnl/Dysnectes_brevis/2915_a3570_1379~~gnl/Dysnectes_brevis/2915_a3570_1379.p1  ORF type:complete len:519 (+),score=236.81 gnl/Dysnectes_brevis/2915_a3570_1379:296-1852(+)
MEGTEGTQTIMFTDYALYLGIPESGSNNNGGHYIMSINYSGSSPVITGGSFSSYPSSDVDVKSGQGLYSCTTSDGIDWSIVSTRALSGKVKLDFKDVTPDADPNFSGISWAVEAGINWGLNGACGSNMFILGAIEDTPTTAGKIRYLTYDTGYGSWILNTVCPMMDIIPQTYSGTTSEYWAYDSVSAFASNYFAVLQAHPTDPAQCLVQVIRWCLGDATFDPVLPVQRGGDTVSVPFYFTPYEVPYDNYPFDRNITDVATVEVGGRSYSTTFHSESSSPGDLSIWLNAEVYVGSESETEALVYVEPLGLLGNYTFEFCDFVTTKDTNGLCLSPTLSSLTTTPEELALDEEFRVTVTFKDSDDQLVGVSQIKITMGAEGAAQWMTRESTGVYYVDATVSTAGTLPISITIDGEEFLSAERELGGSFFKKLLIGLGITLGGAAVAGGVVYAVVLPAVSAKTAAASAASATTAAASTGNIAGTEVAQARIDLPNPDLEAPKPEQPKKKSKKKRKKRGCTVF